MLSESIQQIMKTLRNFLFSDLITFPFFIIHFSYFITKIILMPNNEILQYLRLLIYFYYQSFKESFFFIYYFCNRNHKLFIQEGFQLHMEDFVF